ncbi:flagellar biosynthesis regulator FlaF, partial [Parasedimentitalea maritima]
GFNTLAAALTDNRRLWTIFMADIASPSNKLPQELKEHLVYLTEFTRQHTSKVLARQADVKPLVDINTAIMRGLRSGAP